MNSAKLNEMINGWFVGAFSPTAHSTDACEVAVKHYKAKDNEGAHYHKIATEITLVLSGQIRMAERTWENGDVIVLKPGEVSSFEALTDATLVVVKVPGALNDKYLVEENCTSAIQ